jgi:ComF family protein
MFDGLLSIVAPHLCYSCGKTGAVLCQNCKYDISLEYFSACMVCGGPAGNNGVCSACPTSYSRGWCVGERSGALRAVIDSYKFNNNYAAHRVLAALLSDCIGILPRHCIIVPVPTVSSHIRQRGYDHAYMVAKKVAKLQGRPLEQPLSRLTSSKQRGEDRESRRAQASQAFAVQGALDPDAVYVLVDDVITTGATLHYAGKALIDAGAGQVWAGVIARQPLD